MLELQRVLVVGMLYCMMLYGSPAWAVELPDEAIGDETVIVAHLDIENLTPTTFAETCTALASFVPEDFGVRSFQLALSGFGDLGAHYYHTFRHAFQNAGGRSVVFVGHESGPSGGFAVLIHAHANSDTRALSEALEKLDPRQSALMTLLEQTGPRTRPAAPARPHSPPPVRPQPAPQDPAMPRQQNRPMEQPSSARPQFQHEASDALGSEADTEAPFALQSLSDEWFLLGPSELPQRPATQRREWFAQQLAELGQAHVRIVYRTDTPLLSEARSQVRNEVPSDSPAFAKKLALAVEQLQWGTIGLTLGEHARLNVHIALEQNAGAEHVRVAMEELEILGRGWTKIALSGLGLANRDRVPTASEVDRLFASLKPTGTGSSLDWQVELQAFEPVVVASAGTVSAVRDYVGDIVQAVVSAIVAGGNFHDLFLHGGRW